MLKLSIITIEKEYPVGLKRTLESLASQIIPEGLLLRHLLCEAAPGAGSVLIKDLRLSEISKISSSFDTGLYNAMNRGLGEVSDGWVLFLNAGDTLVTKVALEEIFNVLINTKNDIVQFQSIYSDKTKRPKKHFSKYSLFLGRNMHIHPALLVNVSSVGGLRFDENYKIAADYKMAIELIKEYRFQFADVAITNFEGGGISTREVDLMIAEMQKIRIETKLNRIPLWILRIWNYYFAARLRQRMRLLT